ncbi:MAG: M14 family metallopeptidase [Oscillospiraceae bacterium]|nr:M14 family metallopeptidase [Oscillospiraceae bacterium]
MKQYSWKASHRLLAMLLVLAMLAGMLTVPVTAATAPATATIENLGEGADQISLTEGRDFQAMIPVDEEADLSDVAWFMLRDSDKTYLDTALYPYQTEGGALEDWTLYSSDDAFFSDVTTGSETVDGQKYLTVTFSTNCYFGSDPSVPHTNGGAYMDVCGYFDLTAKTAGGTVIGTAPVKIAPYDDFHTMAEIYEVLDDMVAYAADNTDVYLAKASMGQSSGVLGDALDMPYLVLADQQSSVTKWLEFTKEAETNPEETLDDIKNGVYDDLRVPVMYSNIHSNEVAASDGILDFIWMLLHSAASDGKLSYNNLTGFTAAGEQQLADEMAESSMAVPDLVKDVATYLGYLRDGSSVSGKIDLDAYYTQETVDVNLEELLDNVFFVLVPEENVEGRTYLTRAASNGYDLNRDNSFQTTSEDQNMQHLIATFNPVSVTEFHGRVKQFQCEPCDPPHEPNFEYDLLAEHLMTGGEALGIAAVANNDSYNSYVIPQRDYLTDTGDGTTYWSDPWDDMSTSYTPQFAMLQGAVAYTVELPAYSDDTAKLAQYGCVGQSNYIAAEKLGYLTAQVQIFERGVTNFNSNDYSLVGQWLCDQNDVEGAEMELFRPTFDGADENGNFYPECYLIPMDGAHQTNLQAAYDMMTWLSRNGVKIKLATDPFTYDGVTYPAGTMIVSMYQAKRSVANGALYDGTLIQSWTVLYSEGITSFAATRGFDMLTVAQPAAYKTIDAVCSGWMDYEECLNYAANLGSYFTGEKFGQVILSNASEDSTAAVNALLRAGKTVGMVDEQKSEFYGDFICSYADYLTVRGDYVLSATGITGSYPAAKVITKAPTVYITGAAAPSTRGSIYSSRVSSAYNWNYDRCAMELMNMATTDDPTKATVIVGASKLSGDALTAVQGGTPYIGYGSGAASGYASLFGTDVVRSNVRGGMDCLAYVTYENKTLVNGSYVLDGDNVLYGYGAGWFDTVPETAEVLVRMDGTKTPTEGFIPDMTAAQAQAAETYLHTDNIQAFAYEGKDANDNDVKVVLFANTLTNKVHQRDEYAFISNFAFSTLLGDAYTVKAASSGGSGNSGSSVVTPVTPTAPAMPFTDVPAGAWYEAAAKWAYASGIASGATATTFAPAASTTRGMIVTMLYRMSGETFTGAAAFADVPASSPYATAIAWAAAKGIVTGYDAATFGTNDSITREQLAVLLCHYAAYKGLDTTGSASLAAYRDGQCVHAYAESALQWAVSVGILEGTDNSLLPTAGATRAQTVTMLYRLSKLA